jgi:arsenical pump membrane protein
VSDALALILAIAMLAASLAAAVTRPPWMQEAVVAAAGAAMLVAVGAISVADARHALSGLGPTVGFLAALLVLAEGCRREGLFEALGAQMAVNARGSARRLLALVFCAATGVTAMLGLDATVVLLTPIVFATSTRMRTSSKPHVYACSHLANSASLLLPVSNLTNLLAFDASGLSFTRFAALMALPTVAVLAVEWLVFSRFFATELERPRAARDTVAQRPLPRWAVGVLASTLIGFCLGSLLGIEPVWIGAAGAAAITLPALIRGAADVPALVRVAEPGFLVFVLGLGVIVAAASERGLGSAIDALVPAGDSLPELLLVAGVAATLANVVNNLPATLALVPIAAASGPTAVLAVLIGVNVGPNLTYAGSLATLLWRRVLHSADTEVELSEFVRLGVLTVPAGLVAATVLLWFSARGLL